MPYTAREKNGEKITEAVSLSDKLTGRLIGLARATEGNDHLISTATSSLVMEGLASHPARDLSVGYLTGLIQRVEDEKYRMVPDCKYCTSPCGRTNDYDMNNLYNADPEIRSLKTGILEGIRAIGAISHRASLRGYRDDEILNFLYLALFSIGMDDWGEEELLPILQKTEEMRSRSLNLWKQAQDGAPLHPEA